MKLNGNDSRKTQQRARPRARRKKGRGLKIILGVLTVLVLAVAAYSIWERPPEQHSAGLNVVTTPAAPPSAAPEQPQATPAPDSGRNEDAYTFLVVGTDKVGANTDTIMVGRLDAAAHTINVVSIPRDTLVNTPHSVKKVNALYAYNLNDGGNGIDGLKEGVADLLGFPVDFYAVVNLTAFEKMVDAVGGVYYDVPVDMFYEDDVQGLSIAIPAGYQWLSGENALKVVRFRAGYASADIGRIGTQQDFLLSVAKQMLTLGNIPNLPALISIVEEYVKTDLSAEQLSFLARQFLSCKSDSISFQTMPGNYNDSIGGFSYVSLDLPAWLQMVNESLNPWRESVTEQNVNILTHENGVFHSTSGEVEGGEGSFLTVEQYKASMNS